MAFKRILLSQGKCALVDAEDYEWLIKKKWYADNTNRKIWYAKTNLSHAGGAKKATAYMHRIILNPPKGMHIDHINHDTLDNRRSNLRICTAGQNRANEIKRDGFTSKYKGVSRCKQTGKWCVFIKINRKNRNLGRFPTQKEAALVYNKEAKKLFGEFALLNIL